jgi:cell division septal protein FtsQ
MNRLKKFFDKLKILTMWTFAAAGAAGVIAGAYNLYTFYDNTRELDLRKIVVKNNDLLSPGEVALMSGLKKGIRITELNIEAAVKNLNSSSYIADSEIIIIYPGTVVITVKENSPIAFINSETGLKYVNRAGQVMGRAKAKCGKDIPIIVNENDEKIITFLNTALDISPFVYHQISEIESSEEGIRLFLSKSSAKVVVGNGGFDTKIVILDNFLKEEYGNIPFKSLEYIDLRFDGQVVMKDGRSGAKK